jgi:hypothetical protein
MNLEYNEVYPTDAEINDVLNECNDNIDSGKRKYPGMSYEDGVKAALEWLLFSPDVMNTYSPME